MLQAKAPRATIQDVAALSGLSICTVSRALRNLPNVSAGAQAKVSDAAAKLGYRPSPAAARLAGGSTGSVAIIAPTATAWFFAQAVEAAEEVFAGAGYDTVLISLRNRPSVHSKLFGDLAGLSQRVDGILALNIALSEAELAAVLGHEIGHVTARHSVRQYSAAVATNIGFTIGSILVPELGSRAGQSLLNVLGGALLSGYGRDHELEADRLGAEYLARTDYEPRAIIEVLTLLKNQELLEKRIAEREGRQPRVYHGVFASHPSSDERLQQVVGAADQLRTRSNGRVERNPFLQRIDGLAFGDSEAQGVRRGSRFYHSGLNITLQFPDGWRVDNTPAALRAASPAGDAVMQFETTARGAAKSPQEYLVANMKLNDLHDGRAFTVGTASAYSGATRMQTPFGARDARVGAVFLNQQAYRFLGAARENSMERLLHDTMLSLRPLRPEERALAKGLHVRVFTAKGGETFAELAKRSPLKQEPEAALRILNDRYPAGEPAAGELLKTIQ